MNLLKSISFLLLLFPFFLFLVDAQTPTPENDDPMSGDAVSNFQPSLAVVIGVLCVMFGLTLFLVVYTKFCHRGGSNHHHPSRVLHRTRSRFSGIDKTVVESLPFFKFSSLKGSKQGLECAVCLSKFEDIEILRLLPKCKHAFHIGCIDQWLEKHSSCPLCRQKINAEDPTIFTYSNSMRFLWNNSELREDSNVELYVQREEQENNNLHGSSSRFSIIGSSFRKTEKGNIENEVLIKEEDADADDVNDGRVFHKFNHKIIVPDVVFKNRWSSVSSSDLMFLNSEMLNDMSSNMFSEQLMITKAIENVPSTSDSAAASSHKLWVVNQEEKRSVSEITGLSRFRDVITRNRTSEASMSNAYTKEERIRQLWLPIARRTVQWFANRENRSRQSLDSMQHLDV